MPRHRTYISCLSLGPSAGSYRPPTLGLFRSSRRIGLTICLTEMRLTSSVVRKENDMLETVDGMECAIFILTGLAVYRNSRAHRAFDIKVPARWWERFVPTRSVWLRLLPIFSLNLKFLRSKKLYTAFSSRGIVRSVCNRNSFIASASELQLEPACHNPGCN